MAQWGYDYQDENIPTQISKKPCKVTNKYKEYGRKKTAITQSVYIAASLVWIFILYYLCLYQTDLIGLLILFIPILAFAIAYANAGALTIEVEEDMFKANFLSLGLLILLPLLTWIGKDFEGDKSKFVCVIILALIFTMLSLIDIWVRRRWFSIVKHIKSVFQTLALTLIIYSLYSYYAQKCMTDCKNFFGD